MIRAARAAALAAALATVATTTPAVAGEYTVAQCDPRNRGHADAAFARGNGGDYAFRKRCDGERGERGLAIRSISGAPRGHRGAILWSAPPGTGFVAVRVAADLRRDGGHRARLGFVDATGSERQRVASGRDQPGGFELRSRRLAGAGAAGFQAELVCAAAERCPRSEQARTAVRDLRLTLRDHLAPSVGIAGALLSPGWVRGARPLSIILADRGSGVRRLELRAEGRALAASRSFACETIPGTALAAALEPCSGSRELVTDLDTGSPPFADGVNELVVCARDFGPDPNRTCERRSVRVDNTPPRAAFRGRRRSDPELIEAAVADAHAGVAAAEIAFRPLNGGPWRPLPVSLSNRLARARVDSSASPPGRYLFRLRARDRAGNLTETTRRADGSPLVLRFPLRARARLSARLRPRRGTHPYGTRPLVKGRLRGGGAPAAGEPVLVIERFAPGSRPERRVRTVLSDREGRFRARLGAGPSRRVLARYRGSPRLLPVESPPGRIAIAGSARLALSRARVPAGGRVRFRGRVRRRGARIPSGGKLVELQVRERGSRRFRTVRQALRTDERGRVRIGYSFDRFYRRPARFQFRLRVTPEAGWPYRAPAHSRPRSLTVLPR